MHPPVAREVGPRGATSTQYESCRCADCMAEIRVDARAMARLLRGLSPNVVVRHATYSDALGRMVCESCGASAVHQPVPHKPDCPVVLSQSYIEKYG